MRYFSVVGLLMAAVLFLLPAHAATAGKKVGVVWAEQSGMAEAVVRGLVAQLKAKAPDLELEFKINLKDNAEADKVCQEMQQTHAAVVYLRSPGASFLAKNPPKAPCFIGAANNPVHLGLMKDLAKPEGLVTGVTYYVPAKAQVAVYKRLFPELKSVGLLVKQGHPSAPIEQAETKAACEELKLAYHEAVCADKAALVEAVKQLKEKADLLIMGNQNLLIDAGPLVGQLAGKTPVMSYAEKPIYKGALGGLVADDQKLGKMLADQIVSVVGEGKAVKDVPVGVDAKPRFLLNMAKVKELGVKVPDDLLAEAVKVGE